MNEEKRAAEGEMGSGDSDDEFYNVKLPCTPTVLPASVSTQKVKKVYSPSRTKVKYDYKFDSSSDDESDHVNSRNEKSSVSQSSAANENGRNSAGVPSKEMTNLPQNTYKVVEKINEELKNMKKSLNEKQENVGSGHMTTLASNGSMPRNPMGVVSPVVMVPPAMVVPQASVMGMSPVVVPSPNHMVGMAGTMLRAPSPMGGIIANPTSTIPNVMMAMNTVQNNIVGLPGPGIMTRPGVMGLQTNVMRMAGNNMFGMQRPGIAAQGSNNMIGIANASALMGMQNPGNPGGLVVNPSGLMVVGGLMGTPATQANLLNNSGNAISTSSAIRPAIVPQRSQAVRPVPPPPPSFLRNRPPAPPNFKWQANIRHSAPQPSAVTNPKTSSSPPKDDDGSNDADYYWENKGNSQSDFYESQSSSSPPPGPAKDSSNTFKNDGSFMEMFKKMSGEKNLESSSGKDSGESNEKGGAPKKPPVILSGIVGKRRGGRVLKTGLVKKVKKDSELDDEKRPKDAWSMYMAEVKKYREASCEEEGKTRPLVK